MLRKLSALVAFFILTIFTVSAQTPPNNEIWYTTTDGSKITFNANNLVSHNYNNGRGVLKFRNSVTSIGKWAFKGCSSLTSITIPDSVTEIEGYAFWDCSSLTSINIPNSVTSIGEEAFYGCSSLTSITIPNSVTSIGNYAFRDCSSLTSITIPDSVTSIKMCAFMYCSSLTSITIPNSVTSIGSCAFWGCSSLTSINIPNSVIHIGDSAFAYCSSLTSITIPNSVTCIRDSAFYGCSSLTNITIPNSVTSIEYHAFEGCSSLTSINIPNSVTSIGSWAFYDCSNLTSITIPNSVTSVGGRAFAYCYSLKSFKGKFASSDDRCLIKDGKLIAFAPEGLTSYSIPNSVTSIGEEAFYGCSSLTSITIPNSVTSIGWYAFYGCSSLTSITIPDSVIRIGYGAFSDCGALKHLTIGCDPEIIPEDILAQIESVTILNPELYNYFAELPNVKTILFGGPNASADGRCWIVDGKLEQFIANGITEYFFSETITEIGMGVFGFCDNIKSISIPNTITKIGDKAFYDCDGLMSIVMHKGVVEIGADAFAGCGRLRSVKVANIYCYDYFKKLGVADIAFFGPNASADGRCWIVDGKLEQFIANGLTKYAIPESVTKIGDGVFKNCNKLTHMTLPNSITSIGVDAFAGCTGLKHLNVGCDIKLVDSNILGQIKSVTLLEGVKNAEHLKQFRNIKSYNGMYSSSDGRCLVVDGRLIRFVGDGVTHYAIPYGVTKIDDEVLCDCSALTSIALPESLKSIGSKAFYGCSGLTDIVIPNGVTWIGANALNCFNLVSLTCLSMRPPTINHLGITSEVTIYVPKDAVKAYKNDEGWAQYAKQMKRLKTEDYIALSEKVAEKSDVEIISNLQYKAEDAQMSTNIKSQIPDNTSNVPNLVFYEDMSAFDDFDFEEVVEHIVEEDIFVTVEEMPTFKGGDFSKFRIWVQQHVKYPQIALENGIQGNVVVKFVVEKDGRLSNIVVLQSPDKSLSDAVVQVLQKSPKWKPGKQRNKPMRVTYTLPVSFKIQQ